MRGVRAYDTETGEVVWQTSGLTMNPIPSPVAADGLVILMSGFRGNSLKAIRFGEAKGDITGSGRLILDELDGQRPISHGRPLGFSHGSNLSCGEVLPSDCLPEQAADSCHPSWRGPHS